MKDKKNSKQSAHPWKIPVPVKPSFFKSLKRSGDIYNIQTELGNIQSYGSGPAKAESDLLYVDLQNNVISNAPGRLGSGRSGYYRGKYLKGIGRTLLSGNWNNTNDLAHSSGHLYASAAIREYLVTQYLDARGFGSSIVCCEGLLLGKLSSHLAKFKSSLYGKEIIAPIDSALQGITYKQNNFARASNLLWCLRSLGNYPRTKDPLISVSLFLSFLIEFSKTEINSNSFGRQNTPKFAAKVFFMAQNQTIQNFYRFYFAGVYWGSFHNNYSLDGRFLDLELPLITGGPTIGVLVNGNQLSEARYFKMLCGSEVIRIIYEMKKFNFAILSHFDFLMREKLLNGSEDYDLANEFKNALSQEMRSVENAWMYSRTSILNTCFNSISKLSPTDKNSRKMLKCALEDFYFKLHTFNKLYANHEAAFTKLDVNFAQVEPTLNHTVYVLNSETHISSIDAAKWINSEIVKCEAEKDIDSAFKQLERTTRHMRSHVTKTSKYFDSAMSKD